MGLTTDPTDACLDEIEPSGQQKCYLVLSDEEIARGYVRPVRQSYIHLACGGVTTMDMKIAQTYARDPDFYGGTFCVACGDHFVLRDARVEAKSEGERHWAFKWVDGVQGSEYVGE